MKDNKDIAIIEFPEKERWKYLHICNLHKVEYNLTRYPTYWGFEINEENLSKLLYFVKQYEYMNIDIDILQKAGVNKFGW